MRSNSVPLLIKHLSMVGLALAAVLFAIPRAEAQSFSVIYSFTGGSDGGNPTDGFVIGSEGNLYGTASVGGANGAGVVFKLSETGAEDVLYSFTGGADGGNPNSRLIFDASGNLYGTGLWRGKWCWHRFQVHTGWC